MTESKNNKKEEIKIESHPTNTNVKSEGNNSQKQCKSCFQKIHISATVCQHCGRSQNRYMKFFQTIPILVPLVMAIIAGLQLYEAHQKNVDASNALETAKAAAKDASEAKEIAKTAAEDTKSYAAEVKQQLTETDSTLHKAKENLANLESYSQYYEAVIAAQGEDRTAYDQLSKWAADNSFPFREHAQRIHQKIMDDHSLGEYETNFAIPWKEGVDPNKLTFEQLKQNFSSANQDPYLRRALLEYIWKRNDVPKILRLDFMVDVIRTDKDLMVCEYAGRYFTKGTELKIKPLALDILIKRWADNRSKFEEKPDPNK